MNVRPFDFIKMERHRIARVRVTPTAEAVAADGAGGKPEFTEGIGV